MLFVYNSHSVNELFSELLEKVPDSRSVSNAPHIITPNHYVSQWLRLNIARSRGVAINLKIQSFRRFVEDQLPQKSYLLSRMQCQHILMSYFSDRDRQPEIIKKFFSNSEPEENRYKKLVEVSSALSQFFFDYQDTQPEALESWLENERFQEQIEEQTHKWVFEALRPSLLEFSWARENEECHLTLLQGIEAITESSSGLPKEVHFFGCSYLVPALQKALKKLSHSLDVHIYCQIAVGHKTSKKDKLINLPFPVGVYHNDFQPDEISYLDSPLKDKGQGSVLKRLKQYICLGQTYEKPIKSDDSFNLVGAVTIHREVEYLAQDIWNQLRQAGSEGDSLHFHEIAVIVPKDQLSVYQAHIRAVFPQAQNIPYTLDQLSCSSSVIGTAFMKLINLLKGSFSREGIIDLLSHPNTHPSLTAAELTQWIQLIESLGIFHGLSSEDHKKSYIKKDLLNIKQGLRRLTLGLFMNPCDEDGPVYWQENKNEYLPCQVHADQVARSMDFIQIMRRLMSLNYFIQKKELRLEAWCHVWLSWIGDYIVSFDSIQKRELEQLKSSINELSKSDCDGRRMGSEEALEILVSFVNRVTYRQGRPLIDGVAVTTLETISFTPFKIAYLVGFNEGAFPSDAKSKTSDLRYGFSRNPVMTPQLLECEALVRVMMLTERSLNISFLHKDSQSGEKLNFSSFVDYLTEVLDKKIAVKSIDHPEVHLTPLHRHEEVVENKIEPFDQVGLEKVCADSPHRSQVMPRLRQLDMPTQSVLGLRPLHQETLANKSEMTLSLSALKHFLINPLEGWARAVLGLYRDDALDLSSDENFLYASIDEALLLKTVYFEALNKKLDFSGIYDAFSKTYEYRGEGPTGTFKEANKDYHLELLEFWKKEYETFSENFSLSVDGLFEIYRSGVSRRQGRTAVQSDPLYFDVESHGKKLRVKLLGETDRVDLNWGSLVLTKSSKPRLEHFIRAYVDLMFLQASGLMLNSEVHIGVLSKSGTNPARIGKISSGILKGELCSRKEAVRWFETLVKTLVLDSHDYLLPCEALMDHYSDPEKLSLEGRIKKVLEESYQQTSLTFTTLLNIRALDPHPQASDLGRERLGGFFTQFMGYQLDG